MEDSIKRDQLLNNEGIAAGEMNAAPSPHSVNVVDEVQVEHGPQGLSSNSPQPETSEVRTPCRYRPPPPEATTWISRMLPLSPPLIALTAFYFGVCITQALFTYTTQNMHHSNSCEFTLRAATGSPGSRTPHGDLLI